MKSNTYYENYILDGNTDEFWDHTPSITAKNSFFYVQRLGHFLCSSAYFLKRQGYDSFLLLYSISGIGKLKYRDKEYTLEKGSVFIIHCEDYQEYYTEKNNTWEFKFLHFNGNSSYEYFRMIYQNFGSATVCKDCNLILQYINELIILIEDQDRNFEIKASCVIVEILTFLMISSRSGNDKERESNVLLAPVLKFIEEHYFEEISIDILAKITCCSSFYFIKFFKKNIGYTPHEYLLKYRMNKSKALLTGTQNTIDEIAHQIGFQSTSNFIKTFKKNEALTPAKFRKMHEVTY